MTRSLLLIIGIILFSCSTDDVMPEGKEEERKILKVIEDQEAVIDLSTYYNTLNFSIRLSDDADFKGLFPLDTLLIDSLVREEIFLNEYVKRNEGKYWYRGYLEYVSQTRFKVKVSGEILNKLKGDQTLGLNPFKLNQITLIKNCPINYTSIDAEKSLVNSSWRLVGLTDESGEIIVHPSCEYNFVPLIFSDNFVQLQPGIENTTMRAYSFNSGVWSKDAETCIFGYTLMEGNKLKIYFEFRPYNGWRNSLFRWHNLLHVTKDIAHIDQQLKLLFKHDDMLDYEIEKNLLRLKNQKTGVYALFVGL